MNIFKCFIILFLELSAEIGSKLKIWITQAKLSCGNTSHPAGEYTWTKPEPDQTVTFQGNAQLGLSKMAMTLTLCTLYLKPALQILCESRWFVHHDHAQKGVRLCLFSSFSLFPLPMTSVTVPTVTLTRKVDPGLQDLQTRARRILAERNAEKAEENTWIGQMVAAESINDMKALIKSRDSTWVDQLSCPTPSLYRS